MGAYGRPEEQLDRLVRAIIESTGSRVCALYRKNERGAYIPVFWLPHAQEPAQVASASDLAARLRTLRGEVLEMDLTTFKDGPVRRGMESYGITTLISVPLRGDLGERYLLTAGRERPYHVRERDMLASYAEELSSSLEVATLSARIRGAALCRGGGMAEGPGRVEGSARAEGPGRASGQTETRGSAGADHLADEPRAARRPYVLLTHAVRNESFQELADGARRELGIPGCCIDVEDPNGLTLAESPAGTGGEPAGQWLSLFPRLPYLDQMEDTRSPVFVPATPGTPNPGRLVIPLFGQKNLHGLISVYPISRSEVAAHAGLFTELSLSALYLLRCQEASRGRILKRSLDSVENERARIAIELHDETSQNLVALKVRLATAQRVLAKGSVQDAVGILEDCSRITDEILDGVNRLAADLRPSELAYLGLRQAIEAAAEARLDRAGIGFSVTGNATSVRFSALQENMLLSGVVEALSNCTRHAHATHVEVEMHSDGSWLTIAVRDNGQGFDVGASRNAGYGIKSMSDCADAIGGHFWIGSTPGVGTTVRFSVPTVLLEEAGSE